MPPPDGVSSISNTSIASIADGTSNTAAWSERPKGDFTNSIATEKSDLYWPKTFPSTPDTALSDCRSVNAKDLGFQGSSTTAHHGSPAAFPPVTTTRGHRIHGPACFLRPDSQQCRQLSPGRREHASFCCDGSVRFMKDTVNLTTWRALATRSGGEVISADSY